MTAEEFTRRAPPEQAETVRQFVSANPVECQGTDPDRIEPLLKRVSDEASTAPPKAELTPILLVEC